MSTPYEIPLVPSAQYLAIKLGGKNYNLTVKWNAVAAAWVLDIADSNNVAVLLGIPLITGADLLAQYPHLTFGGKLVAQTDNNINLPPAYANLGSSGHLYFVTTP